MTTISYNLRLAAVTSAGAGSILLCEHLYQYGFEPTDFIGHEWYGVLLIVIGIILGVIARRKARKSLDVSEK